MYRKMMNIYMYKCGSIIIKQFTLRVYLVDTVRMIHIIAM